MACTTQCIIGGVGGGMGRMRSDSATAKVRLIATVSTASVMAMRAPSSQPAIMMIRG